MRPRISSQHYLYFILILVGGGGFFFTLHMPYPEGFFAFITVLSLAGLGVSFNIWRTKRSGEKLVCPTGSNCEAVTGSKYSTFLSISVEYWGMAYFTIVALLYFFRLVTPDMFSPLGILLLTFLSLAAGFFSLYLLFVQAFLLRQWCIWCILTALLSLTIAITSLVSTPSFSEILTSLTPALLFLKYFGFMLGVGAATSAAFLFFHFLDDAEISEKESDAIKSVSEIVWVGLGFALMSSFALIVADPSLLGTPLVTVQVSALLVCGIAGAALMIIYCPFMIYIPFGDADNDAHIASFGHIRKVILMGGAVALASWYFAFLAEFLAEKTLTDLFSTYLAIILLALSIAFLWDHGMDRVEQEE